MDVKLVFFDMLVSITKIQNKEAQVSSNTRTKRSPKKEKRNTKGTRHENKKKTKPHPQKMLT